jgi:hypothetical protein
MESRGESAFEALRVLDSLFPRPLESISASVELVLDRSFFKKLPAILRYAGAAPAKLQGVDHQITGGSLNFLHSRVVRRHA